MGRTVARRWMIRAYYCVLDQFMFDVLAVCFCFCLFLFVWLCFCSVLLNDDSSSFCFWFCWFCWFLLFVFLFMLILLILFMISVFCYVSVSDGSLSFPHEWAGFLAAVTIGMNDSSKNCLRAWIKLFAFPTFARFFELQLKKNTVFYLRAHHPKLTTAFT